MRGWWGLVNRVWFDTSTQSLHIIWDNTLWGWLLPPQKCPITSYPTGYCCVIGLWIAPPKIALKRDAPDGAVSNIAGTSVRAATTRRLGQIAVPVMTHRSGLIWGIYCMYAHGHGHCRALSGSFIEKNHKRVMFSPWISRSFPSRDTSVAGWMKRALSYRGNKELFISMPIKK